MEKCSESTGLWEMRLNIYVLLGLSIYEDSKCPALGMLLNIRGGGLCRGSQEMLMTLSRSVREKERPLRS